jgi:hypothetical protein
VVNCLELLFEVKSSAVPERDPQLGAQGNVRVNAQAARQGLLEQGQPVADAGFRYEQLGLGGIPFYFLPQVLHVNS